MNLIIEGVIFIPQFQKSPKFRRKAPLAPGKQDLGCKVCICDGEGLSYMGKPQHGSRQESDANAFFSHCHCLTSLVAHGLGRVDVGYEIARGDEHKKTYY